MKMMKHSLLFVIIIAFQSAFAQELKTADKEKEGILFLREEEKLARDVYDSMFVKWDMNPFENIRQSERHHMSMMLTLVKKYSLEDPVKKSDDKAGVFQNNALQKLYNDLITKGSESEIEALKAGALIEETDINDLKIRKAQSTDDNVIDTYELLINASHNHLRAFTRRLKAKGITYTPVVLSQKDFTLIINSKNQCGKGCGGCK